MNLQGKVVTKKIQSVDLALIMNKRPHPPPPQFLFNLI